MNTRVSDGRGGVDQDVSNLEVDDRVTPVVSTRRPVTAVLAGAFIVVCAATAGLAAVVPDLVVTDGGVRTGWNYPPQTWALILALAAVALVWREPAGGWRALVPARPGYVVLGAAVALLLSLAWSTVQADRDIIPVGHAALMYSLPWGAGLAAIGWLRGRTAAAAGLTVTLSALLCTLLVAGTHMLAHYSPPPTGD